MSGPKSASYAISDAVRREQAAVRAARGRARALLERGQRLRERVAEACAAQRAVQVTVPSLHVSLDGSRESLERWNDTTEQRLREAEQDLDRQIGELRTAEVVAALRVGTVHEVTESDVAGLRERATRLEREARQAAAGPGASTVAERIGSALAGSSGLPEHERQALDESVAEIVAVGEGPRAERLLLNLEAEVDAARARAGGAALARQRGEGLLAELLGFDDDPDAQAAAGRARQVAEGGLVLDAALEAELRAAIAAATSRAEDRFVREAVAGALEDLGYEVGEEFETLQPDAYVHLRPADRPGWDGYAVHARVGQGGEVRWHVVRDVSLPVDPARDLAREAEWCADLHATHAAVHQQLGIDVELHSQREPGEVAVFTVSAGEIAQPPVDGHDDERRSRRRLRRRRTGRKRER